MFFVFVACSSQEADNGNNLYVQIENTRFHPRFSHRYDVEAFLGPPSRVQFFDHMLDGFHWLDFTTTEYLEEGIIRLRFSYNVEGNIIGILISPNFSREAFIFGRRFNDLNHATVTHLLEQADVRIFHTTENFIGSFKPDSAGGDVNIFFWFDDASNITWLYIYYENPWA